MIMYTIGEHEPFVFLLYQIEFGKMVICQFSLLIDALFEMLCFMLLCYVMFYADDLCLMVRCVILEALVLNILSQVNYAYSVQINQIFMQPTGLIVLI